MNQAKPTLAWTGLARALQINTNQTPSFLGQASGLAKERNFLFKIQRFMSSVVKTRSERKKNNSANSNSEF